MEVGILGPLTVTEDGRPVEIAGAKPRALLAMLAVRAGRVVTAGELVDDLWGDDLPSDPSNALQRLVSRLRKALGPGRVESRSAGYRLDVSPVAVDAVRFERLASEGRAALDEGRVEVAATRLREALDLWRGPALADFAEQRFARPDRIRLENLRIGAVEDLVETNLAIGATSTLVAELEALVHEYPLRERLRGQLMRALYRTGRQADALAAYQDARVTLAERLGLDPSPELQRLQAAMLARDAALDPPARPRTNLRAPLTSFVGRDAEVRQARALLGKERLVTLTGPGGSGKTRLALEVAAQSVESTPDGVWLVELAPLRDPSAVPHALASVLGVTGPPLAARRVASAGDPLQRILARLATKRLTLVVDNCEHLVDAAATLAEAILGACPGVRILATSREALGVPGETRWPVPALRIPDAARLFEERARAVRYDFSPSDEDAEVIAEICRRLDGLPLAVELAAARVPALPLRAIAERLDDRFRLLTGGSRTALPRQRTLRAVVDWSWDLLAETERLVLRRLSAFAGGATLEAAEAVTPDVPGLLDVVARLLDKSLLMTEKGGDGRLRYRMLETVRVYAAERLAEAGEASGTRRAHAEFFVRLAEAAEPECRSKRQVEAMQLLDAEQDNVNAALGWAVDAREGEIASRLAGAMAWFWWLRGGRAHAAAQLDAALQVTDASPTRHRARALLFRAAFDMNDMKDWSGWKPLLDEAHRTYLQLGDSLGAAFVDLWRSWALIIEGDRDGGIRVLDAALEVFDGAGDDWSYANGVLGRAANALYSGDIAAAARDGAECLDRFRVVGDQWMIASAMQVLATVAEVRGDYHAAVTLVEEALVMTRTVGATDTVPFFLARLGNLFALQGELDRADTHLAEALGAARAVGYGGTVAFAYFGMGLASRRRGALDQARAHLEESLALSHAEGLNVMAAPTFAHLGFVLELQGDHQRAETMHREGLRLAGQFADPRALALAAEGLAGVAAAVGNAERAALLLGWAAAARASAGAPLPPAERIDVDRAEGAARRALGESRITEVLARGAAMSLDQVTEGWLTASAGTVEPPA